jgi:hypothetical protein
MKKYDVMKKQIRFNDIATYHSVPNNDDEPRQCTDVVDRMRFQNRINKLKPLISSILQPSHRDRIRIINNI